MSIFVFFRPRPSIRSDIRFLHMLSGLLIRTLTSTSPLVANADLVADNGQKSSGKPPPRHGAARRATTPPISSLHSSSREAPASAHQDPSGDGEFYSSIAERRKMMRRSSQVSFFRPRFLAKHLLTHQAAWTKQEIISRGGGG